MQAEEVLNVKVAANGPNYKLKDVESLQQFNFAGNIEDGTENVNGTVDDDDDRISVNSTLSDLKTLELPQDIPDGPQFQDLGAYIASVPLNDQSPDLFHIANLNHASSNDLTNDAMKNFVNGSTGSGDLTENIPPTVTSDVNEIDRNMVGVTDGLEYNANFANFDCELPAKGGDEFWAFDPKETSNLPMLNNGSFDNPEAVENTDSDDDFGDFECSTQLAPEVSNSQAAVVAEGRTKSSRTILECLLSRLGSSLDKAFELPTDGDLNSQFSKDCACVEVDSRPDSKRTLKTRLDNSNDQIWHKLCNPDRIPELRQHWWKSSIYASFLHSIDVNPGNAMPAFASQLRLLEPVRLDKPAVSNIIQPVQTVNNVHTSDSQTSNQRTDDTNISEYPGKIDRTIESTVVDNSDPIANTELNGIANLDLDFFENQIKTAPSGNSQSKGAISMLNDLEAELLCQAIQPPPPTTISLLPTLTSSQPSKRATLSETVLNTLSRLPKLAYMRSSRLMFPVQGQERSLTE